MGYSTTAYKFYNEQDFKIAYICKEEELINGYLKQLEELDIPSEKDKSFYKFLSLTFKQTEKDIIKSIKDSIENKIKVLKSDISDYDKILLINDITFELLIDDNTKRVLITDCHCPFTIRLDDIGFVYDKEYIKELILNNRDRITFTKNCRTIRKVIKWVDKFFDKENSALFLY